MISTDKKIYLLLIVSAVLPGSLFFLNRRPFMKNIINFYVYVFAPLSIIVLLAAAKLLGSLAFFWLLMIYALIYHPYISGLRLIAANKIKKSKIWYSFIPTWNWRYFAFLFFYSKN